MEDDELEGIASKAQHHRSEITEIEGALRNVELRSSMPNGNYSQEAVQEVTASSQWITKAECLENEKSGKETALRAIEIPLEVMNLGYLREVAGSCSQTLASTRVDLRGQK